MVAEEIGRVATSTVDAMKSTPLAIVRCSSSTFGFLGFASCLRARHERRCMNAIAGAATSRSSIWISAMVKDIRDLRLYDPAAKLRRPFRLKSSAAVPRSDATDQHQYWTVFQMSFTSASSVSSGHGEVCSCMRAWRA